MTFVDDRGRLGGQLNLIDAAAAVVILLLIPLGFSSYVLFRTPPAKLLTVSPARLVESHDQRVEIDGTNLRPFMRASFNTVPAKSFLIGSTKYALVDLPDLEPGTYDVVLYDHAQEVDRLPNALTVVPMVTDVELELVGSFKMPPAGLGGQLKTGDKFPPTGNAIAEVVAVEPPSAGSLRLRAGEEVLQVPLAERELPATLRVKCHTSLRQDGMVQCLVPGVSMHEAPTVVAPDAVLMLSSASGVVAFQIRGVRAPSVPIPTGR
jgi:hypothetical protein